MKKTLLITAAVTMLTTSIGFAAPITDLNPGESNAGINYFHINPKLDGSPASFKDANAYNLYLQTAASDKFTYGIEYTSGSIEGSNFNGKLDSKFFDVFAEYKVANGVRVIAGNRNYDTTASIGGLSASGNTNKFFYGLGFNTKFDDKTEGYASWIHNSLTSNDYTVGVNYNIDKNTYFNLAYRSYHEDEGAGTTLKLEGISTGLNFKF